MIDLTEIIASIFMVIAAPAPQVKRSTTGEQHAVLRGVSWAAGYFQILTALSMRRRFRLTYGVTDYLTSRLPQVCDLN